MPESALHPAFSADPVGHFHLYYYELLARLLGNLHRGTKRSADQRLTGLFTAYPFLAGYAQMLADLSGRPINDQAAWWAEQIAALEARVPGHLPLRALRQVPGLGPEQVRLLMAVGAVEEDIRFGAVFAALQEPLEARSPCLGLLGWLVGEPDSPLSDPWLAVRPLIEAGLVQVVNRSDPRTEWRLSVPPVIWDALRGRPVDVPAPGLTRLTADHFPALEEVVLPTSLYEQLTPVPAMIGDHARSGEGMLSAIILRGMKGVGRLTTLGALARASGRDVLLCERLDETTRPLIGPLAVLMHALPVLRLDPGPSETLDLPLLAGYDGTVGITLGRTGGVQGALTIHALTLTLPPPDDEARARLWVATGAPLVPEDASHIVSQFVLTGGLISQVASMARAYAALDGREAIGTYDVQQAARSLNRQALDTLATGLESVRGWEDLVVSTAVMDELLALELRCRQRERLFHETGPAFRRNLNRGVRAMFSGPSGTGKTLAARALAAALNKDIYRVNFDATVSKYIGETERNLNEVFSRAEELDVILLIDEGDGLLTRRTDVSNANDRYANLETNYLLQRLESYEGIVVITTNASQRIDTAFLRRLDVVIEFSRPEKTERLALWRAHLPQHSAISPDLLDDIAARCALTGGQIRNASLVVALLALDANRPAGDEDLLAALQREYRKAGAAYPLTRSNHAARQSDRLRALLDSYS